MKYDPFASKLDDASERPAGDGSKDQQAHLVEMRNRVFETLHNFKPRAPSRREREETWSVEGNVGRPLESLAPSESGDSDTWSTAADTGVRSRRMWEEDYPCFDSKYEKTKKRPSSLPASAPFSYPPPPQPPMPTSGTARPQSINKVLLPEAATIEAFFVQQRHHLAQLKELLASLPYQPWQYVPSDDSYNALEDFTKDAPGVGIDSSFQKCFTCWRPKGVHAHGLHGQSCGGRCGVCKNVHPGEFCPRIYATQEWWREYTGLEWNQILTPDFRVRPTEHEEEVLKKLGLIDAESDCKDVFPEPPHFTMLALELAAYVERCGRTLQELGPWFSASTPKGQEPNPKASPSIPQTQRTLEVPPKPTFSGQHPTKSSNEPVSKESNDLQQTRRNVGSLKEAAIPTSSSTLPAEKATQKLDSLSTSDNRKRARASSNTAEEVEDTAVPSKRPRGHYKPLKAEALRHDDDRHFNEWSRPDGTRHYGPSRDSYRPGYEAEPKHIERRRLDNDPQDARYLENTAATIIVRNFGAPHDRRDPHEDRPRRENRSPADRRRHHDRLRDRPIANNRAALPALELANSGLTIIIQDLNTRDDERPPRDASWRHYNGRDGGDNGNHTGMTAILQDLDTRDDERAPKSDRRRTEDRSDNHPRRIHRPRNEGLHSAQRSRNPSSSSSARLVRIQDAMRERDAQRDRLRNVCKDFNKDSCVSAECKKKHRCTTCGSNEYGAYQCGRLTYEE